VTHLASSCLLSCPERHGSGSTTSFEPSRPRRAPGASLYHLDEEIDMTSYFLRSVWRRLFPRLARTTADRIRRQLVRPRSPEIALFSPSRPSARELN
jgi:hypothetical protein